MLEHNSGRLYTEKRKPSFSEQLLGGIGKFAGEASQAFPEIMKGQREKEAFGKIYGEDTSNLSPEIQKIVAQGAAKKKEGEMEKFALALDTLGQMRSLLGKGNIGTTFGVGINPLRHMGESGHDREQFAHYGRSLIPLVAAGVPVKNKNEFEEYKKIITNPDATIGQIEGAIDGLEHLFKNKAFGLDRDEEEDDDDKKDFNIIQTPDGRKVKVPHSKVKDAIKMGGKILE